MKKKITALLLALGCALGVGTMAACAQKADAEKPTMCNHSSIEYILVEVEDKQMLQPRIHCADGCLDICLPDVKKVDCEAETTPPTCKDEGNTVYTYNINAKDYVSQKIDITKPRHNLETIITTKPGQTLCLHGGIETKRCKDCDCCKNDKKCDYEEVIEIKPQNHKVNNWKVEKESTFEEKGLLVGTCETYKGIEVNGEIYNGCGRVEKELPIFNNEDYETTIINGGQICGEFGTTRYTYSIDGQSFSFVGDFMTKRHVIKTNDGINQAMDPYGEVIYTDKKYSGKWEFFSGEKSDCTKSEGTGAWFKCEDCAKAAPIMIKTLHVPDKNGITEHDELYCDVIGKITYTCDMCKGFIEETKKHEYSYTLTIDDNEEFYTLDGVCANCDKPDDDDGPVSELSKIEKNPTCNKDGYRKYSYVRDGEVLASATVDVPTTVKHKLNGEEMDLDLVYNIEECSDIIYVDNGKSPPCEEGGMDAMGLFTCGVCKEQVAVKIKGHTWQDVKVIAPDCVTARAREQKCMYCSATQTVYDEETYPALGHDWTYESYIYVGAKSYTVIRCCERGDCNRIELYEVAKDKCKAEGVDKTKPICKHGGELRISFKDEVENVTVTAKVGVTEHILDGVEKPYYDKDGKIIVYMLKDEPNMDYLGCTDGKDPCEEGSDAEGCFRCQECGERVDVKIIVPHTKPDNLPANAKEYECIGCGKREKIE